MTSSVIFRLAPAAICVLECDPKSRLEGELREGLTLAGKREKAKSDTMPAYRNAIRDEQGRHVVE